jgi:hypothetical protein
MSPAAAPCGAAWLLWNDRAKPLPLTLAPLAVDTVVMICLLTAVMFNCLRANEEASVSHLPTQVPVNVLLVELERWRGSESAQSTIPSTRA